MAHKKDTYIQDLLKQQPYPPRQVSFWRTLRNAFSGKQGPTCVFFFGLACSASLVIASFDAGTTDRIIFLLLSIIPLVIFSGIPFLIAFINLKMLRNGKLTAAVVVSCEYLGKGSNLTLDAMENGAARGEFRLPDGSNRPFLIDEKGA